MPLTGERISVYDRLSVAWRSCAVARCTWSSESRADASASSTSCVLTTLAAPRSVRRSSSALLCASAVSARATAALAESAAIWNSDGSMAKRSCPFCTIAPSR